VPVQLADTKNEFCGGAGVGGRIEMGIVGSARYRAFATATAERSLERQVIGTYYGASALLAQPGTREAIRSS
jgi:hypothetical protein